MRETLSFTMTTYHFHVNKEQCQKMRTRIRKLIVGIIVVFLAMSGIGVVLGSTSVLSKSLDEGFSVWVEGSVLPLIP